MNKIKDNVILIIAIFLGAMLRFIGLFWGGTSLFEPDESSFFNTVIKVMGTNSYLSKDWLYPNQVTGKLLGKFFRLYIHVGNVDTFTIVYAYRILVCVLSTLIIYIAYKTIMVAFSNKKYAIIVAFAVALFPCYIKLAKFMTGDTTSFFFESLVVLASAYYFKSNSNKHLVIMSLLAALSMMEKWNAGIMTIYIACIVIFNNYKRIKKLIKQGVIAGSVWGLGCLAVAPNLLWDYDNLMSQMLVAKDYDGAVTKIDLLAYFRIFYGYSGIIVFLLSLIGIFFAIKENGKKCIIFIVGPVYMVGMALLTSTVEDRLGFLAYYIFLMILGYGIYKLIVWTKENMYIGVAMAILVGTVSVTYLAEDIRLDVIAASTDQDFRIKGEKELDDIGVTLYNSISEQYTPYRPGFVRKDGTAPNIPLDGFIEEIDGQPYNYLPGVKYIVISNRYSRDREVVSILDRYATPVLNYENGYMDMFWDSGTNGGITSFEPLVIYEKISDINKLLNGANIGFGYTVYDISNFNFDYNLAQKYSDNYTWNDWIINNYISQNGEINTDNAAQWAAWQNGED